MGSRSSLTCPFKSFLLSLSRNLKTDDLEEAKFISTLGGRDKEKITSWTAFFEKLKELGHISENNVSELISIFKDIGRDDLAEKCQEFKNSNDNSLLSDLAANNSAEKKSLTETTRSVSHINYSDINSVHEAVNCTRSPPDSIQFEFDSANSDSYQPSLTSQLSTLNLDVGNTTAKKKKSSAQTNQTNTPQMNSSNAKVSIAQKGGNKTKSSPLSIHDSLASSYQPPPSCQPSPDFTSQLRDRLDIGEQVTSPQSKFSQPVAAQQGILVCCSGCKEPLFDSSDIFKRGQNYLVKTPNGLPDLSCSNIAKASNGKECNKVLGSRVEMAGIENCFQLNNDRFVWRFSGEKNVFQDIKKWQKVSFYVPEII